MKSNKLSKHRVYHQYVTNSESKQCSNVGTNILERGGNAIDASISTAICIGIVNSFSSGIGGGGFMLIRRIINDEDEIKMIDFREVAPKEIKVEELNSRKSEEGGMAIAIPGEVLGFYKSHEKYGKLEWKVLFEANVKIAKEFKASKTLAEKLKKNKKYILRDPGLREIYAPDGKLKKEGEIIKRNNYARTLEKIADDPLSFYEGKLADKIVRQIKANGGVMSLEDLREYRIHERAVLKTRFKDYDVYTTNLPSCGIMIVKALNLLEHVDFETLRKKKESEKFYEFYKMLIHVLKATSERRGELGDPGFIKNADEMLKSFVRDDKFDKAVMNLNSIGKEYESEIPFVEDHGTTHLEVVDSSGSIVQITSTINLEFGSKIMDIETGIVYNNEVNDFYIPNAHNAYDLTKMPGNILKPGKRPVSSAAPLFLIRKDEVIAIGATGGSRIPSAIIGAIAYWQLGKSFEEAVSMVRVHNQLSPNRTYVEKLFPVEIWNKLSVSGEKMEISELNTIFTSVQVIHIKGNQTDKIIHAISDYRKGGDSAGK